MNTSDAKYQLILPANNTMILIADIIDTNNNVLKTNYFAPIHNMNNVNLLAKSLVDFHEIEIKVGIIEDYVYELILNNNYVLKVYAQSQIYDYNQSKFINIEDATTSTEFFCDIIVDINKDNSDEDMKKHIKKIENNIDINALVITYAKGGLFPYLTQKNIKHNRSVYNGKKVRIKEIKKLNKEKNIVAIIERSKPIVNMIYYI